MGDTILDPIIVSLIDRALKDMAINHAKNEGDDRMAESLKDTNGVTAYNIVTLIHGEPPKGEK